MVQGNALYGNLWVPNVCHSRPNVCSVAAVTLNVFVQVLVVIIIIKVGTGVVWYRGLHCTGLACTRCMPVLAKCMQCYCSDIKYIGTK